MVSDGKEVLLVCPPAPRLSTPTCLSTRMGSTRGMHLLSPPTKPSSQIWQEAQPASELTGATGGWVEAQEGPLCCRPFGAALCAAPQLLERGPWGIQPAPHPRGHKGMKAWAPLPAPLPIAV